MDDRNIDVNRTAAAMILNATNTATADPTEPANCGWHDPGHKALIRRHDDARFAEDVAHELAHTVALLLWALHGQRAPVVARGLVKLRALQESS